MHTCLFGAIFQDYALLLLLCPFAVVLVHMQAKHKEMKIFPLFVSMLAFSLW